MFKSDYGLKLGYHTAYHAKDLAIKDIHGDDDLFYYRLRWNVDVLKENNPGSYVILEVEEETNAFKRVFIAIAACLNGYKFCHPMLSLDDTFLEDKVQEYLSCCYCKRY
ncbi:Zinc finger protein [Thalictrum thalictroides]|uniref:Zinc finger protein n=1 Tax=Thalictrum thalictroides TaxID=46969 RepID=A0A7J6UTR1_THATH|nr:Zinc finger protein [Thalictrum thalictroides]